MTNLLALGVPVANTGFGSEGNTWGRWPSAPPRRFPLLNHATQPGKGKLTYLADVYEILGSLEMMAGSLP
jgi:hypothetical protein